MISKIQTRVGGGWQWSETVDGPDGPETTHYWTNERGHGLWQHGRQIKGTSQFNLECAPSTRRRRVAKFMQEEVNG
jgi:hypothetical protein